MKLKVTFWIFSLLYNILTVIAFHGGKTLAQTKPNPTGISPIEWMIFAAIFMGVGYFFYWMFSREKKKF